MGYHLKNCVWEITLACCFSCKYCGSKAGKARERELNLEECLSVVEQLSELGCETVSMIGGEVFMRKDWEIIAQKLTSKGIQVAIISNGFLFTDELIEKLKNVHIDSVAISIDGPERVHDKYRQKGSYVRCINAVKKLTQNGVDTSVISTLNSENVELLSELYELLKSYPLRAWQLQGCSPMGNAASLGIDYKISAEKVTRFVLDHIEKATFQIGVADNIGFYGEGEGFIRGNSTGLGMYKGCSAGISSIGIDSIGNVRGCESMYDERFVEGNLREKSLSEIWNNPDAFSYNRKFSITQLTGHCAQCEYGIFCGGGCRSYNYFVHGNMYEAPFCVRNRAET